MPARGMGWRGYRMRSFMLRLLACCGFGLIAMGEAAGPLPAAPAEPDAPVETPAPDSALVEPDLEELPLSNAARVRLDRARDSVVQVRGFLGSSEFSAFHGSGFVVTSEGLIVTNFHVVADAVLYPGTYRLSYTTTDGRSGGLRVYAVDAVNDLAILKADNLELPPLRLRLQIPERGERAYAIGFPLNLGLTITEGVANGLLANSAEQRIHYTGPINSGMSGGPALDANGAVYGVNVSTFTRRQLVSLVVPARLIQPLLARAREPLDETLTARQARELVASQILAHQATSLALTPDHSASQVVAGYTLPTRVVPNIECSSGGGAGARAPVNTQVINCSTPTRVVAQLGLEVGYVTFQHRVLSSGDLHGLQFARQINQQVAAYQRSGSDEHVAPYACQSALITLDGFDARVTTCARQYRLFVSLYDMAVTVVSIDNDRHALISQLDLRGVSMAAGTRFARQYLRTMRWMP